MGGGKVRSASGLAEEALDDMLELSANSIAAAKRETAMADAITTLLFLLDIFVADIAAGISALKDLHHA
jgi:hypothetical protein